MDAIELESASLFAALADPTRLRLLQLLARQPEGAALCVNALAARLGVSQPAVSQHLRVLRNVGLVYPLRRGMRVHYFLDRERLLSWQHIVQELFTGAGGEPDEGCAAPHRATSCDELGGGQGPGSRPPPFEEV